MWTWKHTMERESNTSTINPGSQVNSNSNQFNSIQKKKKKNTFQCSQQTEATPRTPHTKRHETSSKLAKDKERQTQTESCPAVVLNDPDISLLPFPCMILDIHRKQNHAAPWRKQKCDCSFFFSLPFQIVHEDMRFIWSTKEFLRCHVSSKTPFAARRWMSMTAICVRISVS